MPYTELSGLWFSETKKKKNGMDLATTTTLAALVTYWRYYNIIIITYTHITYFHKNKHASHYESEI
jgi:hypothetical protein